MHSVLQCVTTKRRQDRTILIAVFSVGIMLGFFASSLVWLWSPILQNSCNERYLKSQSLALPRLSSSHAETGPPWDGWKVIHVFYGSHELLSDASIIPTPYFKANKWFSQYRQDEIVSKLLHGKQGGFFVDLAANDAVRISNTYALETFFDWRGVCLEPNPIYWSGLSYRKCHVAAAVVGSQNMEEISFKFPKSKTPKGGIIGKNFDNKEQSRGESRRQFTVRIVDVFRRFNVPRSIDYISLDVEGAEDLVMSAFPFSEYRFKILTIERPSQAVSNLLESHNYIRLKELKSGKETLWIDKSFDNEFDMSALLIDSQNYKYRENTNETRKAPELKDTQLTTTNRA